MREKCDCGNRLPLHLFEVAKKFPTKSFGHICLCERKWVWNDDQTDIIQDGTSPNPHAQLASDQTEEAR